MKESLTKMRNQQIQRLEYEELVKQHIQFRFKGGCLFHEKVHSLYQQWYPKAEILLYLGQEDKSIIIDPSNSQYKDLPSRDQNKVK